MTGTLAHRTARSMGRPPPFAAFTVRERRVAFMTGGGGRYRSRIMNAGSPSATPVETRLRDLRPAASPVEFVARVVTCERRDVTRKSDGSRRPLVSGLLSDGTATVRFTWWDPPREGIERGVVLRAVGAEVREFRGRPEVTFSWKTRVALASPAELPKIDTDEIPFRNVQDLRPGEEGFRIEVRVVRIAAKPVTVGAERRVVHEGLLADRTGSLALSAWSDFGLKAGEAVRIAGGYVRGFRGRPQLVLDERSSVVRVEGNDLPDPAQLLRAPPRSIAQIEDEGGGEAVAVEGVVVGLLPPSGLVYRCPTCHRSVRSGICRVHGQVEGQADLRTRIVLDDGTGALTVNANRTDTERLWGVTLEEARNRLRNEPDPSLLEEEILESLLGRRLRVRGLGTKDDFGITITPESIERVEIDLDAAAEELTARLREPS
jgi:ssDNA-binding replication factor A large subunit